MPYKQFDFIESTTDGSKVITYDKVNRKLTLFDGDFTKDCAISEIKKNTRRFAKRQLTWFRKDQEILWFDYQKNYSSKL